MRRLRSRQGPATPMATTEDGYGAGLREWACDSWWSSSLAHAVHCGLGEDLLELVAAGLEAGDDLADLGTVRRIAGRTETDVAKHLLHLALGKGVAVG